MNEIKVKIMKALILLSVSGLLGYITYRSFIIFFEAMNDIHKLVKIVVRCI